MKLTKDISDMRLIDINNFAIENDMEIECNNGTAKLIIIEVTK